MSISSVNGSNLLSIMPRTTFDAPDPVHGQAIRYIDGALTHYGGTSAGSSAPGAGLDGTFATSGRAS